MGIVPLYKPQFLAASTKDFKLHKLMFIKKGGKAVHKLGDLSRATYDAELICVSNETESDWIGNYAEGFGFYGVHFEKADCRDATEEEVQEWINNKYEFKYGIDEQ